MYNFNFHRPKNLEEANHIFRNSKEPKYLAGGMTLIPTMKQHLASPSDLIDLSEISELSPEIAHQKNSLVIGSMASHSSIAHSSIIKEQLPALGFLAGNIGDPAVRNRGTFGGSVCNADPAADYPAALLALSATLKTNKREIKAADFFTGMFETALSEDEILISVSFPIIKKSKYFKLPNPASRYAIVGVFIASDANNTNVAITGASSKVFLHDEMGRILSQKFESSVIKDIKTPLDSLNDDIHASAAYRSSLITSLAMNAVDELK